MIHAVTSDDARWARLPYDLLKYNQIIDEVHGAVTLNLASEAARHHRVGIGRTVSDAAQVRTVAASGIYEP